MSSSPFHGYSLICFVHLTGDGHLGFSSWTIIKKTSMYIQVYISFFPILFLSETGSCYAAELLSSSNLPDVSASLVTGTTGMHHHTRLTYISFLFLG